jgi:SAM-dependent methyltransferase
MYLGGKGGIAMLAASLRKILSTLRENDRVLDVGGGVGALARADYVTDILPYDERRPAYGGGPRRYSKDTWVTCDVCSGRWPFDANEFDFVVCSHVLEDVRDPLQVCAEMIRVGKRGYLETPSRLAESTRGVSRPYMAGHSHHRWLVEIEAGRVVFTMKQHKIHKAKYSLRLLPNRRLKPEFAAQGLFWTERFDFEENYPQNYDKLLLEFKRRETLRGKTEWKHTPQSAIRKLLLQFRSKPDLPPSILDRAA